MVPTLDLCLFHISFHISWTRIIWTRSSQCASNTSRVINSGSCRRLWDNYSNHDIPLIQSWPAQPSIVSHPGDAEEGEALARCPRSWVGISWKSGLLRVNSDVDGYMEQMGSMNTLLASNVVYFIVGAPNDPMGNVIFLPRIKKTNQTVPIAGWHMQKSMLSILDFVWTRKRFTGSQSNSTWQVSISDKFCSLEMAIILS